MSPLLLYVAAFLFLSSALWNAWAGRTRLGPALAMGGAAGGWLMLCATIVIAWMAMDRPPFKTFYETFILLAWCMAVVGLVAGLAFRKSWLLSLAAVVSGGMVLWALSSPDLEESLLPPALQSFWFVPHVTVYFFGYSMVILAGLTALASLIHPQRREALIGLADKLSLAAFLFLGTGLCLGAIWADDAWGTWWAWDPKECWALVTWLTIAAYRHLPRHVRLNSRGACILVVALGIVAFTYLGMHLLPTADLSDHVYSES